MREKVWVFGDSYGYRNYPNPNNTFTWPIGLEQQYDVSNYCMWGSSLDYSLKKLIDVVDKVNVNAVNTSDINVIFLLTYELRFDFRFLDPGHHYLPKHIFVDDVPAQFANEYTEYYPFIKDFFEYYVDDYYQSRTDHLKTVGLLRIYSQIFKKILILPCFLAPQIKMKNCQDLPISFVNDNRFHLVNGSLSDCHRDHEFNAMDPLPNHLSESKHREIYEQLCNWIDHNAPVDENVFKI